MRERDRKSLIYILPLSLSLSRKVNDVEFTQTPSEREIRQRANGYMGKVGNHQVGREEMAREEKTTWKKKNISSSLIHLFLFFTWTNEWVCVNASVCVGKFCTHSSVTRSSCLNHFAVCSHRPKVVLFLSFPHWKATIEMISSTLLLLLCSFKFYFSCRLQPT